MQLRWVMEAGIHLQKAFQPICIMSYSVITIVIVVYSCICLRVMCIAWVALSCPESHWKCCSAVIWGNCCGLVAWAEQESQKLGCGMRILMCNSSPWRKELLAELITHYSEHWEFQCFHETIKNFNVFLIFWVDWLLKSICLFIFFYPATIAFNG